MSISFNSPAEEAGYLIEKFIIGKGQKDFPKSYVKELYFLFTARYHYQTYKAKFRFSEKQLVWMKDILVRNGFLPDPSLPLCQRCEGTGVVVPPIKATRGVLSRQHRDRYAHPCHVCKPAEYKKWVEQDSS